MPAPIEVLKGVRLFADLETDELEQIARLFKERDFKAGEVIIKEGSGGASFYVIEAGEATVTVGGDFRATLKTGDYFGEIALLDEGARMATVTASTYLDCWGLTLWEFRPLVEENGVIAWKMLQTLGKELRQVEQILGDLRGPAR
jgi:CRP-like cAMP-binding protein